jgi:hypothetical protein
MAFINKINFEKPDIGLLKIEYTYHELPGAAGKKYALQLPLYQRQIPHTERTSGARLAQMSQKYIPPPEKRRNVSIDIFILSDAAYSFPASTCL